MTSSLTAIEKTLVVLDAAVNNPTFSEITARTGLAKATVHRILGTLIDRQFLVMSNEGHYLPGPRFLALAGAAFAEVDITALVSPLASELAQRMQCTVHVGARIGDEVVYLVRADSDKPYRMPSRVGATIPLHTSAIGKAILAKGPEEEVRSAAARAGLRRLTARTITTVEELLTEITHVKRCGYALDLEENVPGVVCIGTAFDDYTKGVNYGVSISTLALEHSEDDLAAMAPDLLETARLMSEAIGGFTELPISSEPSPIRAV